MKTVTAVELPDMVAAVWMVDAVQVMEAVEIGYAIKTIEVVDIADARCRDGKGSKKKKKL